MDFNTLRGISTAILLVVFIAFVFWAFSKKRKQAFSEAELLPFDDDVAQQIKEKREVSNDE